MVYQEPASDAIDFEFNSYTEPASSSINFDFTDTVTQNVSATITAGSGSTLTADGIREQTGVSAITTSSASTRPTVGSVGVDSPATPAVGAGSTLTVQGIREQSGTASVVAASGATDSDALSTSNVVSTTVAGSGTTTSDSSTTSSPVATTTTSVATPLSTIGEQFKLIEAVPATASGTTTADSTSSVDAVATTATNRIGNTLTALGEGAERGEALVTQSSSIPASSFKYNRRTASFNDSDGAVLAESRNGVRFG